MHKGQLIHDLYLNNFHTIKYVYVDNISMVTNEAITKKIGSLHSLTLDQSLQVISSVSLLVCCYTKQEVLHNLIPFVQFQWLWFNVTEASIAQQCHVTGSSHLLLVCHYLYTSSSPRDKHDDPALSYKTAQPLLASVEGCCHLWSHGMLKTQFYQH